MNFLFRSFILCCCISCLFHSSDAQVFGDVTVADFTPNKDYGDASAVILSDQGQSTFYEYDGSFNIRFIRSKRILILNKEGLNYGDISINYYQDGYNRTELIDKIEAYTYNIKNGSISKVPVNSDDIYTEKIDDNWRSKKFAMPQVEAGSIIEYTYTLLTPFMFNLPDWKFQNTIPTEFSSYEVRLIPFYEYAFLLQGASAFDDHQSYVSKGIARHFGPIEFKDMVHVYTMKDVPAFEDESFITTPEDYIIKLDFQLAKINYPTGASKEIYTTWEDLSKEYTKYDNFGKWLNQAEKQAGKILDDLPEFATANDKVPWIINYVKDNYEWTGQYSRFGGDKIKDFLNSRQGNSAEINLFLCGMFRAAGIESEMVLISTRKNGHIKDIYPMASQFNNAVCLVKNGSSWLISDATEDWLPYDAIPPSDINGKGFIVRNDDPAWVELTGKGNSMVMVNFNWKINDDNKDLEGTVGWFSSGYDAFNFRKNYNTDADRFKEYLESNGITLFNGLQSTDLDESDSNFKVKSVASMPYEEIGKEIMIAPFASFPPASNEFKYSQRKYHVDMTYAKSRIYSCELDLPEGYEITEMPENDEILNDLLTFRYTNLQKENKIIIKGELQFKKSIYSANEYLKLRDDMGRIVKKLNERIILKENSL